jgi:alanyl-tRNA synthetase
MTSKEIRQQFIDYFKSHDHTFVPSSPVVPQDDPTLLFTNAGMNQFKDIFLGKGRRNYNRAVNSQKCIRVSGKHNDLEEVGHDTYHHTFFEMLGNWSFGDYYKEEAIRWAWELFTVVWKLPKEKIYATVHHSDDEAEQLWKSITDIDPGHILRFGDKENFWEMGNTGPCGPCSEIHIDLGEEFCTRKGEDHICNVNGDCARYIELWNLVFIQYNRDESGNLNPLPQKHVDTGAGFERIVAVLQGKRSNYDTDVFTPILQHIGKLVGQSYETSSEQTAFRVIADHVRMLIFSIADGGLPSNDGRGYVMRRILRRAARYGRKLNMREPFIYLVVPKVVELMGDAFPEIVERAGHIQSVIKAEEEHFNRTLDRGLEIFDRIRDNLRQRKQIVIPGGEVFKLYDTYGFPADLTRILADESGLTLDMAGFDEEMETQRQRARAASKFETAGSSEGEWIVLNEGTDSHFIGYEELAIETHIMRYQASESGIKMVLRETPFYAESGGQVGDKGSISAEGFQLKVIDTRKESGHIIHVCEALPGFRPQSDKVLAEALTFDRRCIEKNHTATHLLHAALRHVLGTHITQAGSLVEPDRLRFDFTHYEKINPAQLLEIEQVINQKIQQNLALEIAQEKFAEAKKKGAMALFGEKYGEVVRTVQIADFSMELCGGAHVHSTGDIGLFLILTEAGVASGVRRIEAITGPKAIEYIQNSRSQLQQISALLNVREDELGARVSHLLDNKKSLEKQLEKASSDNIHSRLDQMLRETETIGKVSVLIRQLPGATIDQLKEIGDAVRSKAVSTAALLYSEGDGKVNLVCALTDDLLKSTSLKAGDLARETAKVADGGGGGRPHLATAGAKDVAKIPDMIARFKEVIQAHG